MQWQYKTAQLKPVSGGVIRNKLDIAGLDALLNQHGRDGWELVDVFVLQGDVGRDVLAIMKRPLRPDGEVSELRGACPACGYDFRGADHAACPECGWHAGQD